MNEVVNQDIDSATGAVVTPGKPVEHVDVEDGQSIGHTATPEAPESGDPAPAAPAEELPPTPPQRISRDEIYAKAKETRDDEIASNLEGMDEAERQHYDRMVAEAGGGPDPFAEEPAPAPAAQPPQAPAPDPQAQPAAGTEPSSQPAAPVPAGQPPVDPNDELVTITVYGMQEQVPRAEVDAVGGLAAYQKSRAADEKLKRLTTYEASLRDYDRQLSERAVRIDSGQTPAQDATGSPDPSPTDDPNSAAENDLELAQKVISGMFSGDEEQAAKTLAESFASVRSDAARVAQATGGQQPVAGGQPPQPGDPQAVAESRARDEANAVFANEFGDLQTPVLRSAVLNMVQAVAADPMMRGRPLAEITREAATRVRNDVFQGAPPPGTTPADPIPQPAPAQPTPAGVVQATVPTDLGGRMQLKSRTVVTPLHETGARYTPPAGDEQHYPTNSEYVNLLRKGRGQPQM